MQHTLGLVGCLVQLTALDLAGTFCEDEDAFNAALTALQPLTALAMLNVASTGLTGRGLANLSTLKVGTQQTGRHALALARPSPWICSERLLGMPHGLNETMLVSQFCTLHLP